MTLERCEAKSVGPQEQLGCRASSRAVVLGRDRVMLNDGPARELLDELE
jgi:hypothetical protein